MSEELFWILAHSGRNTCLEVLEHSKLPVLISHSNTGAVFKHARNVDDEVLDALKKNGGVIGFTLIPDTYGKPSPNVNDLVKHIQHVKDNFGSEYPRNRYRLFWFVSSGPASKRFGGHF